MGDNRYIDAHIEIYIIFEHFVYMTDSKKTFSKVKINSKSICSVVLSPTFTHSLLNEQFMTSTCKDDLNKYPFQLLVDVRNRSLYSLILELTKMDQIVF